MARPADPSRPHAPRRQRQRRALALVAATATLLLALLPVSPARAATNPMDTWTLRSLFPGTLTVWHAAYVPRTNMLLVAVGGREASLGNELVEVHPATGRIGRHVRLGSDPHRIAVTPDGLFAYVAFGGTSAIAKVDLLTFTPVQWIALPNHPVDGPRWALDIAVAPGVTDTIVAVLVNAAPYSPNYPELWAFTNGVALPQVIDSGPDSVEFQNATTLLGFGGGSGGPITRYTLSPLGLTFHSYLHSDEYGAPGEMVGGLLAQVSGTLLEPTTGQVVRRFATGGAAVEPTARNNRVAFVGDGITGTMTTIRQYDLRSGALTASRAFKPLEIHSARELIATSAGYAIVAYGSGLHLFGPYVDAGAPSNVPAPPKQHSASWQESELPWQANDLLWDPTRKLLYASLAATNDEYANEVVAIDPDTKRVVRRVFVGGEPGDIDLNGLGTALFVTQRETGSVTKIDLLTFLPVQVIPLGTVDGHPVRAGDIAAMPATTDTFAVVLRATDDGPDTTVGGVALFTLGLRGPSMGGTSNVTAIDFRTPVALFGTDGRWIEMLTTPLGVETVDVTPGPVFARNFTFAKNGVAWNDLGRRFEPFVPLMVGFLPSISGPVALDEARNRVFQFDFIQLHEFEKSSGKLVGTTNVNGYAGDKLVLFGRGVASLAGGYVKVFAPPTCRGREATLAPRTTITGTAGDDVIVGTPYDDLLDGRGGNDVICGGGGNDQIRGGTGNDRLGGGAGDDQLDGGAGTDVCDGGLGTNEVLGCELAL